MKNPYVYEYIGIEEALELLLFRISALKKIAVNALKRFPLEDIEVVLLQLVQSLKYESYDNLQQGKSYLGEFLLKVACESFGIANKLNWYLTVEGENNASVLVFSANV